MIPWSKRQFVQVDEKSFVVKWDGTWVEAHLVPYVDDRVYRTPPEPPKWPDRKWSDNTKKIRQLITKCRWEGGIAGLVKCIWLGIYRDDNSIWTGTIRGGTETRGKLTINKPYLVNGETLEEVVSRVLRYLTEREARVLQFRFGLEDGWSRTLEETGRELGVTRERIRQMEARAFQKLRHPTRRQHIQPFLTESDETSPSNPWLAARAEDIKASPYHKLPVIKERK